MDPRRAASFSLDARLSQRQWHTANKIESSWIPQTISTASVRGPERKLLTIVQSKNLRFCRKTAHRWQASYLSSQGLPAFVTGDCNRFTSQDRSLFYGRNSSETEHADC